MKTILRNFFSVLRRFKAASVLNVLGLSIAFVAFMLIMMQVNYDYTFDCSYLPGGYRTWKQRIAGYYLPSVRTGIYRIVSPYKRRMSFERLGG